MPDRAELSELEQTAFAPLGKSGPGFWLLIAGLAAVLLLGVLGYVRQLTEGLGETGLNRPAFWGIYLANFVFFTGISMAGTLISAILRVTQAGWRRSITRIAEAITAVALLLGALQILIDLGRVDRVLNTLLYGRLQSPMLWDFTCIGIYFLSSVMYLYLPLIPDMARLRDRWSDAPSWRRHLYRLLALGWRGNQEQFRRLDKAISIMAIIVIPMAALVHTVVSWLFGMTLQPMWHSTIFGPYFVVGAIFSGIAWLFIWMTTLRKALHLETYIGEKQYNYLGILFLTLGAFWLYFTLAENLTTFYGAIVDEMGVVQSKLTGGFRLYFWGMVFLNGVLPFAILLWRRGRTPTGTLVAAVSVTLGMWMERFLIVVPSVNQPRLAFQWAVYQPTWVELAITAGSFALFSLLFVLFFKLFPALSIWEVEEGHQTTYEPRAVLAAPPSG